MPTSRSRSARREMTPSRWGPRKPGQSTCDGHCAIRRRLRVLTARLPSPRDFGSAVFAAAGCRRSRQRLPGRRHRFVAGRASSRCSGSSPIARRIARWPSPVKPPVRTKRPDSAGARMAATIATRRVPSPRKRAGHRPRRPRRGSARDRRRSRTTSPSRRPQSTGGECAASRSDRSDHQDDRAPALGQGARLKNTHHTRTTNPPSIRQSMPKGMASGMTTGSQTRPATAARPRPRRATTGAAARHSVRLSLRGSS